MEASSTETDELIGQTVGNYQVKHKLGEGGMGSVYLAEHPHIGKKVALKVLHAEFSSNQDVVSRFFNEARAVNDIGHPNIVDIVDYGVLDSGAQPFVYFIMEFLGGRSLSHLIRDEAPLPPERALAIASQVGDALAASHRKGIVHRDLKPDNIMLIQRGRDADFVKLLDFGIAKLTGDQNGTHRTRTGIVMGTPAYMSPEQCEGRGSVDWRTDIYALGIVLYEMLTGRVPFVGEGYGEILVQHLTQPPTPPSSFRGLAPHVEQIVLKALEKRPDLRYPNMEEFLRAMADPVGYVAHHGGPAKFLKTQLVASEGPIPTTSRFSPPPQTPAPGSLSAVARTPTTLGSTSGEMSVVKGRKTGIFVGLGLLVVAAGTGAFLVTRTPATPTAPAQASGAGGGAEAGTVAGAASDAAPLPAPDSATRAVVESSIDAATARKATVRIKTSPGAKVTLDGKAIPLVGDVATAEVDSTDRKAIVTVEADGFESRREEVSLSKDAELVMPLKKKAGKRPPGKPKKPGRGNDGSTGGGDDLLDPTKM